MIDPDKAAEAIARSRALAVKHRKAAELYDELVLGFIQECGDNLDHSAARAVFIAETKAALKATGVPIGKNGLVTPYHRIINGSDVWGRAEYLWKRLNEARKIQRDHDAGRELLSETDAQRT